jgi:hypothetical protein
MTYRPRSVVVALLLGGALGVFLALLFGIAARNTPMVVNPQTFFWWLILLGGAGAVAGMALESVRQLQAGSPEPEWHRHRGRASRSPLPPPGGRVADQGGEDGVPPPS